MDLNKSFYNSSINIMINEGIRFILKEKIQKGLQL
mgnify:CR=1 FL=1